MEDRLRFILSSVNDWLKFAEAKNAALLTADGVIVFSLLRLADGKVFISELAKYYYYFSVGLVAFSALICLISFLPRLAIPWLLPTRVASEKDNLAFYADISTHDPPAFVRALYHQSGVQVKNIDQFEKDLAEQAIVNSRIALRKYRLFDLAVWVNVMALLTPLLALPLFVYMRIRDE